MQEKIRFGSWEAVCLLVAMMGTKTILTYPRVAIEVAGTAGWLLTIYISVLAVIAFFIIEKLYKRFQGQDLLDIGQYLGGNILRVIVGILIAVFMSMISFYLLRTFSEQMKTLAYINSPISFIMVFFLAGMIIVGYLGIEPLVRFQAVLVPVSIAAFLLYLVMLGPWYNITNVLPILGNGITSIFIYSIPKISDYSELLFLFLIVPFIGSYKELKSVGYKSIGLTAFFLTSLTLAFTFIVPYPVQLESSLPAFEMGRIINFGRFFQRIESVFIVTWATMAFMYLSAAFYFTVYIFQKTFMLPYRRPLVFPMAVVIMTMSLVPASLMESLNHLVKYFRSLSGILTFGVTILLLLAANYKKRREKPGSC